MERRAAGRTFSNAGGGGLCIDDQPDFAIRPPDTATDDMSHDAEGEPQ